MLSKLKISIEASINVFLRKPATFLKYLLGLPLFLLSVLYVLLLFLKKQLYHFKLLSKTRIPIVTISIGNVTVGGSGKTPFTLYLAKQLEKKVKLAIISRGYKSRVEKTKETLIVKESGVIQCSAHECGDEPYLLARKTESALVIAGPDRLKSLQLACEREASIALLDDAMQNFSIKKDADILLINAKDLFAQQQFLPFGLFREPLSAMGRCSMVVVNQVYSQSQAEECEKKIREYFSGDIVCVSMQVDTCLYSNEESREAESLQEQPVLGLAGIANP
ncbi:MAG: tetraacyldisaccharide 4'-kinase, partial [Chlamydiales bacterium]|nr:tetraacyldisaccharide 4'-kinase [Chlamydiales bacterium]